MPIIQNLSKLKVIKTYWSSGPANNGIAGIMAMETKINKIILDGMNEQKYNILKDIINPEWQIEGSVQQYTTEVTFIRRENNL